MKYGRIYVKVKMQEKIKENGNRKIRMEMAKYGIWSIESRVEKIKIEIRFLFYFSTSTLNVLGYHVEIPSTHNPTVNSK
jgi:hypothetical protein